MLLAGGQASRETLHIAGFAAEGDLTLHILAQQFAPEQALVGRRGRWRQVDAAAGEVGMLAEHHAEQADGRSLGHGDRFLLALHRLGTTGNEVEAQTRRRRGVFNGLRQMQQGIGAH